MFVFVFFLVSSLDEVFIAYLFISCSTAKKIHNANNLGI